MKVSDDDQPWFTNKLKILDRKRKREYYKHQKSDLWKALNLQFSEDCKKAKEDYKNKIVDDLKTTNPKKWYSKVKRMSGQKGDCSNEIFLEEICHLSNEDQANQIADHFASTRNSYQRVEYAHFSEVLEGLDPDTFVENLVTPNEIQEVIKNLNKNSACVLGDVPMKIISLFSTDLSRLICNLINSIFESGCYPYLWKRELITPVPKINPPPSLDKLRQISGLYNVAKIAYRIIANINTKDISSKRDKCQYGN